MKTKYGLLPNVQFCTRCTMSNQRPVPVGEMKYKVNAYKPTDAFNKEGLCAACQFSFVKDNKIDWDKREKELIELCNKYRSKSRSEYDCIVPGSGGKDSRFTSHILKEKYGMNPLTVTWAPHIYTDIGKKNHASWIDNVDNILITPSIETHRKLTNLAFKNLLHPFQPFVFGQRYAALKVAKRFNIGLVFHGESPFEYGSTDPIKDSKKSGFDKKYFVSKNNLNEIYLGGISVNELVKKHKVPLSDLFWYLPIFESDLKKFKLNYKFLGYYLKWNPQEVFYYAVDKTGFIPNPERTEGTYSKYASLDDRIDGFHYYTSFIKFGLGRATMDTAQEIRNGLLTRDEGIDLVKKYDGEFPNKYFQEILEYMRIDEKLFWKLINAARSPHLWSKVKGEWTLKHKIWE